ncbi:MAG: hypothetical protein ABJZ55_22075 [Fuerstiella sp.]
MDHANRLNTKPSVFCSFLPFPHQLSHRLTLRPPARLCPFIRTSRESGEPHGAGRRFFAPTVAIAWPLINCGTEPTVDRVDLCAGVIVLIVLNAEKFCLVVAAQANVGHQNQGEDCCFLRWPQFVGCSDYRFRMALLQN